MRGHQDTEFFSVVFGTYDCSPTKSNWGYLHQVSLAQWTTLQVFLGLAVLIQHPGHLQVSPGWSHRPSAPTMNSCTIASAEPWALLCGLRFAVASSVWLLWAGCALPSEQQLWKMHGAWDAGVNKRESPIHGSLVLHPQLHICIYQIADSRWNRNKDLVFIINSQNVCPTFRTGITPGADKGHWELTFTLLLYWDSPTLPKQSAFDFISVQP